MTLVELLVVVSLLAILLGVALPIISPADDSRRLREASRAVSTYISGAKNRARETGRPYGVAFKKLSQDTGRDDPTTENDNGVCLELYYVEEPPPYSGFDSYARAMLGTDTVKGAGPGNPQNLPPGSLNQSQLMLRFVTRGNGPAGNGDFPPQGYRSDPIPNGVLRPGDFIQLGDKVFEFIDDASGGTKLLNGYYRTDYGKPTNSMFVRPVNCSVTSLKYIYDGFGEPIVDPTNQVGTPSDPSGSNTDEGRFWTAPLPYKVLRQPTKASGEPLQLNEKTAIDLEASGFGSGLRLHNPLAASPGPNNNSSDVVIMFTPEGAMYQAFVNTTNAPAAPQRLLVSSNLFLLVGLRENIPAPQTDFASFSGTDRDKQDLKAQINWLNGDARWVVVGAQTGATVSVENAFVDPQQYTGGLGQRRANEIIAAREIARRSEQMGGR